MTALSPGPLDGAVEAAIKSLMPEMREALIGEAVCESGVTKLRRELGPARRCALQRRGIVVDRMYCENLTDLGAQVREELLRRRADTRSATTTEADQ